MTAANGEPTPSRTTLLLMIKTGLKIIIPIYPLVIIFKIKKATWPKNTLVNVHGR